jgi:hypothetical protein
MTIKSDVKVEGSVAQIEEEINLGIQETQAVPFATATPTGTAPSEPYAKAEPTTVATTSTYTPTTSTFTPSATATVTATTQQGAQVPPNAPPGGHWINKKYIGAATWSTCAIVSCVTCFLFLLPCGLWALLCPCDQKLVYVVHGKAYDGQGQVVGSA